MDSTEASIEESLVDEIGFIDTVNGDDDSSADKKIHILRCEFFITKKKRRCCMQRKASERFCSEHLAFTDKLKSVERTPCPYDRRHSVWKKDLEKHMKKCNARRKVQKDPWFIEDINSRVSGEEDIRESIAEALNEEELHDKYILLLEEGLEGMQPLSLLTGEHEVLEQRLLELTNRKHASQHSSLIGNMKANGILTPSLFYLELGCGKAEFSRYVNLALLHDMKDSTEVSTSSYGFGFIDRGNNRMKMDSKILKDCCEKEATISSRVVPRIKRSKIDIRHLDLDKFLEDVDSKNMAIISKHLCGSATDLTLRLLFNSSLIKGEDKKLKGLLVATCCRHACSYEDLLPKSREFLSSKGFCSKQSFEFLKKAATWAVCGPQRDAETGTQRDSTTKTREEIGLLARRLIDESRLFAVKELERYGYSVGLFLYIDKSTTLENVCLLIRRE